MVVSNSQWKQILEFPEYWISDKGEVFNLALGKKIPARRKADGCIYVSLQKSFTKNARRFPIRVRHLMENYWGKADS